MTWLLWRQHRSQVLVTVVGTCNLVGNLFSGYGAIIDLVHLSIVLPVILGAFVGATLVAREREQVTNVLVRTQTVTRPRWLYSQIAAALAGTVVASAVVSALVTWWSNTPNALDGNRFEGAQFDTQNVLPIALAIFAVALGIAAGCILRRTLPALATTVAVYVGVRLPVSVYLRPHYLKPITRSFSAQRGYHRPVRVMDDEGAHGRRGGQEREFSDPDSPVVPADPPGRVELPGPPRLPHGRDVPAAESLLAVPVDRIGDLRGPRRGPHHGRGRVHPPP
jgi:hypothetical protein